MSSEISLCESCQQLRAVVSGKGSRFLMCLLSLKDARWKKYPPQPVRQCGGHERRADESHISTVDSKSDNKR